jgi:branched-subunit amino acid transport protein
VSAWLAILGIAAGTLALRVVPAFVLHSDERVARVEARVRHLGPAVLAAMAVSTLFAPGGAVPDDVALRAVAAATAVVVTVRTRSALWPLGAAAAVVVAGRLLGL